MPILPKALQEALNRGVDLFIGEHCEWKLDLSEQPSHVEAFVGASVLVFAENGCGDFLFLKMDETGVPDGKTIYEYLHEGPEIDEVDDDLGMLLGLKERPPSKDKYPVAIYESGEKVMINDRIQIKVWVEFWKGWQNGTVTYVPGISKKKSKYEYNDCKWVAIKFEGGEICPLVDPITGILKKVRFVGRGL